MHKNSDKLFDLIKSLTKQEKRYFKLYFSTQGKDKLYIQLFGFIEKQEHYNEVAIQKRLKIQHLAVTKITLYANILKALRAFHHGNSVQNELRKALDYIDILMEKKQYDESLKNIKKAKMIAEENELFYIIIQIIEIEEQLVWATLNLHGLDKIILERETVIAKIINYEAYKKIYHDVRRYHTATGLIRKERENEIKNLYNSTLMTDANQVLSIRANFIFHKIRGMYFYYGGDKLNYYKIIKSEITIFTVNQWLVREQPASCLIAFNDLIASSMLLDKMEDYHVNIKKFKAELSKSQSSYYKELGQLVLWNLELSYYIDKGEFKEGMVIVQDIEKQWDSMQPLLNNSAQIKLFVYKKISMMYFGTEDYSSCLSWLNELVNDKAVVITTEYYFSSQLQGHRIRILVDYPNTDCPIPQRA